MHGYSASTYPRGSEEFTRVLGFSDGVIAIAITLLVLNIDLPIPSGALAAKQADIRALLASRADQLLAFLVSFVILAYGWMGHHRLLANLKRLDGTFMAWNFGYLLLAVLVPLQAQLIGLYGDNRQALALYSLGFALLFGWDLLGLRLAWWRGWVRQRPNRRQRWHFSLAKLIPVVVFLGVPPAIDWLGVDTASWLWLAIWPLEKLLNLLLPPSPRASTAP
jgi:uncharacterized membrane protein